MKREQSYLVTGKLEDVDTKIEQLVKEFYNDKDRPFVNVFMLLHFNRYEQLFSRLTIKDKKQLLWSPQFVLTKLTKNVHQELTYLANDIKGRHMLLDKENVHDFNDYNLKVPYQDFMQPIMIVIDNINKLPKNVQEEISHCIAYGQLVGVSFVIGSSDASKIKDPSLLKMLTSY